MSLFNYFSCEKLKDGGDNNSSETSKEDEDQSVVIGVSESRAELAEVQESSKKDFVQCMFQELWKIGRPWLEFPSKENAILCSYCRRFSKDKSVFGSQKGNNSFSLDGIKKLWKKLAHDASNCQPGMAPLVACLVNI